MKLDTYIKKSIENLWNNYDAKEVITKKQNAELNALLEMTTGILPTYLFVTSYLKFCYDMT